MKLFFEEENLSNKRKCSAVTCKLEVKASKFYMVKRAVEREGHRINYEILMHFFLRVQLHKAMVFLEEASLQL